MSTATVSRVLAGREPVLPGTKEKVLTAVADLGYVPSGAAKNLAARRTGVLGLCFPDLVGDQDIVQNDSGYWYDEVIRGMERSARRRGYAVLIAASHTSDDGRLVLSIAGRCDGLVVLARTAPFAMIEHVATRTGPLITATSPPRAAGRVGEQIIATGKVPRALVCANDQTAIGAIAALQHAGLAVPGDVAVTGFDGIQLGRHLRPGLTTVVQPMAALGDTAVTMLTDRIDGSAPPQRTVELPVRLEVRDSCGCPH